VTVTVLDDYREQIADLPADRFIGSITWYTVAASAVTRDQLVDWFDELKLDPAHLPHPIKPVDAFRAASTDATAVYPLPGGRRATLMVREVASTHDEVARHIMRETCDPQGRRLAYDNVGDAVFHRNPARVELDLDLAALSADEQPHAETLCHSIRNRYTTMSTHLQAQALRAVVRSYLLSLRAVAVRPSGGVYFVHVSRHEALGQLETLVGRFSTASMLHSLPLVDTGKQRRMIGQAFADEVETTITGLVRRIAEENDRAARGTGTISATVYQQLRAQYDDVVDRTREFTQILGQAEGRATAALELAINALCDMRARTTVVA
jgi:hypothetical protein